MRFLAILPVLLCTAALILSFLCLFAGSSQGFMEDYALITLNTSRFGENIVNLTSSNDSSGNLLQQLINNITDTISGAINDEINQVAQEFGLREFYSLHMLTYCEGNYEPGPLANATVSQNSIWKNVTSCSNRTAIFTWDPRAQLQADLNATGHGYINIDDLHWPKSIDNNIHDIKTTLRAMTILYCVSIALMFICFFFAILSIFFLGRLFSLVNVILDSLTFLVSLIASALSTAIMNQGAKSINSDGEDVGIEAYGSSKFLAITWVATVLIFLASCVWCLDCIIGRRDRPSRVSKRKMAH